MQGGALGKTFGDYLVLGELSRGGQAVVVRAQRHGGEPCALKLLLDRSPGSVLRFRQEGRVLAGVSHPHLVRVLDMGEHGGLPYMAMELVDGQDLASRVARQGLPDLAWSARALLAVADALHHCHARGLVHRDLKPGNVVIERGTDRPVVIDLGLVKRDRELMELASIDAAGPLSRAGELMGTPAYMPPEQVRPDRFGPVGPAADVYALGATLYYLLTGHPPHEGPNLPAILAQVISGQPPDPRGRVPEVPAAVAELCVRCLAKAPAERPASAEAFARELAQAAGLADPLRFSDVAGEDQAAARLSGHPLGERDPRLLGPYEVLALLGRGGMGSVYKARHAQLGVIRAVKVLQGPAHPKRLARFEREVRHLARVRHAGVVGVHDSGQASDCAWYAMDLIGGQPLDRLLEDGALPLERALEVAEGVCRAVGALHAQGIVHRDIKPANVVLRGDGLPVVLDLGLAVAPDLDDRLTKTGAIMGTPNYMAPEQLRGGPPDPRIDVFAIGLLLFELTTGSRALAGDSIHEVLAQVLSDRVPLPRQVRPDLPPGLDAVCARALARDPAARPADANALAELLAALRRGEHIPLLARRRRVVALAVIVVGGLAVAGGWLVAQRGAPAGQTVPADPTLPVGDGGGGGAETASLSSRQLEEGHRELRSLRREVDPRQLAQALEGWLADYPGHPAAAEAQASLEEARHGFPEGSWSGLAWGQFVGAERMLTWSRGGSVRLSLRDLSGRELRGWSVTGGVNAAAVSPDRRLAYAGGNLSLWRVDLERGGEAERWELDGNVDSMALDPSGELLALGWHRGEEDFLLELRSARDLVPVRRLQPIRAMVRALAFTGDGARLIVGTGISLGRDNAQRAAALDNALRIFRVADGAMLREERLPTRVNAVGLAPDGQTFALGANGGLMLVGDATRDAELRPFTDPDAVDPRTGLAYGPPVWGVAFSADGARLLGLSGDPEETHGELATWRLADGVRERRVGGLPLAVRALSLSPAGGRALVSADDELQLWRVFPAVSTSASSVALSPEQVSEGERELRRLLREQDPRRRTEAAEAWLERFALHPRAEEVRAQLREDRLRAPAQVWRDLVGGQFLSDGRLLVWAADGQKARLSLRTAAGEEQRNWSLPALPHAVVCSRDGNQVYLGGRWGELWRLDLRGQDPAARWPLGFSLDELALSPDEQMLAVAGRGPSGPVLQLWGAGDGGLLRSLSPVRAEVHGLGFARDGSRLAVGTGMTLLGDGLGRVEDTDNAVRLFSVADGALLMERPQVSRASSVAVHPDDRTFVVGTNRGALLLFDAEQAEQTGELVAEGDGQAAAFPLRAAAMEGSIRALVFLDGGARLASVMGEIDARRGAFAVWDLPGRRRLRLVSDLTPLQDVSASPDGQRLLITSYQDVSLWRAR